MHNHSDKSTSSNLIRKIQTSSQEMTNTDDNFRKDLARLISSYEQTSGNKVSANFAVAFGDNKGISFAPLSYCRDLRMTDESGQDTPRPSMVTCLDIDHDLSLIDFDNLDDDVRSAALTRQIREYAESKSGPFVVDGGRAIYKKDVMEGTALDGDIPQELMDLLPPELLGLIEAIKAKLRH